MPRGNVDLDTRIQRIEASLASLAMVLLKDGRADDAVNVMQMAEGVQAIKSAPRHQRKAS